MAITTFEPAYGHVTSAWGVAYSVPAGKKALLIECDVCNTCGNAILISLAICQGVGDTPDYYLVKDAPIPAGSTQTIISGQKIVLKEAGVNTRIILKTDAPANTADVIISVLEGVD